MAQKFKYNGKEFEESLGLDLYEMDVRSYDPAIARWTSIDPITHHNFSPYQAFDNNPVYFADPSGADSIYNFETNQYVINGNVVSQEEAIAYANAGGNADGSNNNTPGHSSNNDPPKKYRLMTTVVRSGYVDFKPNKTKNGNDLNVGTQIIVERIEITNKYYIKYDTGKAEHLYVTTAYELKTTVSYDGSVIKSTMSTMEASGSNKFNMVEVSNEVKNVNFDDLNEGHKMVLNKIINTIDDTGNSLAVEHKNLGLDVSGFAGAMGAKDAVTGIIKGKIDPVAASILATHLSIRYTPASRMRLRLYHQTLKRYGSLITPISE